MANENRKSRAEGFCVGGGSSSEPPHTYMRPSIRREPISLSNRIKPIIYLKAHASEIVRTLRDEPEPMIITQNGEAKAVLQDIEAYEQAQETMALLKILALGNRQIEEGRVQPAADHIARLRQRRLLGA